MRFEFFMHTLNMSGKFVFSLKTPITFGTNILFLSKIWITLAFWFRLTISWLLSEKKYFWFQTIVNSEQKITFSFENFFLWIFHFCSSQEIEINDSILASKNSTLSTKLIVVKSGNYTLIQFKWQLYISTFLPFLAIFLPTEVQTVILWCLMGLNIGFLGKGSCFLSQVSKLTSARNKLNLSMKYWFLEANVVFWICYGCKKWLKYHLDNINYILKEWKLLESHISK